MVSISTVMFFPDLRLLSAFLPSILFYCWHMFLLCLFVFLLMHLHLFWLWLKCGLNMYIIVWYLYKIMCIYNYIYIYPCFRLLSNLSTIQKRDDHIIPAVRSPAGWWWRGRRPTEMPRRNSSDICPPSVVPRSLRPASWLASTLVQQPKRRIEEHKEVHRSGMFTYSFIINGIEGKNDELNYGWYYGITPTDLGELPSILSNHLKIGN